MAITRDQAEVIANRYNDRRITNKLKMEQRIQDVYSRVPEIASLDREISGLALSATRSALQGDLSKKERFQDDLAEISQRKKALLLANHYPADYLDEIFTCPDCKDTGYINGQPCHCFKEEVIKLLYSRSELQEILERENFDTFDYSLYSEDFIDEAQTKSVLEKGEWDNEKTYIVITLPCTYLIDVYSSSSGRNFKGFGKNGNIRTGTVKRQQHS